MQELIETVVFRILPGDIEVNRQEIIRLIGFTDEHLPDPYPEMIEEEMSQISQYDDIAGGYVYYEKASLQNSSRILQIGNSQFGIGPTVGRFLKGTESAALFICTAGKKITDRITELTNEQKLSEAYICDVTGTLIVESAMEIIAGKMKTIFETRRLKLTNCYSPGYCEWDVSDQHKLFSFFPEGFCGVRLTPSALMFPVKSISGVIGIGRNVRYNPYQCEACHRINCLNRKSGSFKDNVL